MNDDALTQVSASLKALQQRQVRILTGMVTGTSTDPSAVPVRLDNDGSDALLTSPVVIPSVIGLLTAGTRVSILTVPPAGMIIVGIIGLEDGFSARDALGFTFDRIIYLASDTWVKPDNPLFLGVTVRIQSGGGGSGGTDAGTNQSSTSAGGQGGGYIEIAVPAASLTPTVAVTVGAGGAAAAAGPNSGGTGGTSSFGAYGSIQGGDGGAGGGVLGGGATQQTSQNGGTSTQTATVTGGAVLIDFQPGDDGGQGSRWGSGTVPNVQLFPGFGGGSRMGAITRWGTITNSATSPQIAPAAGWAFGGGASGRGIASAGAFAAGTGAAGAQGLVIAREWYRV